MSADIPRISNPSSFWHAAQAQRVCAVCHSVGPFDAHHVVDKNELKKVNVQRNDRYDTRNALRLCSRFANNCHLQHENRALAGRASGVIKTSELLDENIEYAFEVLSAYAYDYLRQEYDDEIPDARIRLKFEGWTS